MVPRFWLQSAPPKLQPSVDKLQNEMDKIPPKTGSSGEELRWPLGMMFHHDTAVVTLLSNHFKTCLGIV